MQNIHSLHISNWAAKSLVIVFILLGSLSVFGQKIGYVNTTKLLENLTMMKNANDELAAIQNEYRAEGQGKVKALEDNFQAYIKEAQSGTLSKKQMAEKEAALQQQRQEVMDYDTKAQVTVEAKRQAIFKPVLQKIDEAIQAYGKANGYAFILDSGMGHLMYKPSGEDLTEIIRKKLEQ